MNNPEDKTPNADSERLADVACYAVPLPRIQVEEAAKWLDYCAELMRHQLGRIKDSGIPKFAAAFAKEITKAEKVSAGLKAALHNGLIRGFATGTTPRRFVKMFNPRFAALVESGRKVQTVRAVPKRMPKRMPMAGDIFDGRMWEGKPYRSRQVPLRTGWIRRVELVEITVHGIGVWDVDRNEWTHDEFVPSDFARADGFESWEEMRDWFRAEHDLPFRGILIVWDPRDEIAQAAEAMVRRFLDHDEPVRIAASAHDRQLMETVDAAIAKAEGRVE